MQTHLPAADDIRGLRPVTPALLRAEETARRWRGLPDNASKGDLLQLLEDVRPQAMKVCKGARDFAHWLVKMQPAACFIPAERVNGAAALKQGLALVSTYQDPYIAAALNVSVRTLARWRAELAEAGWIAFRDAPDRTRYRKGPAEAPEEAYGIDLRPLVVRFSELEQLRTTCRDAVSELLKLRKGLSMRRNRLRCLLPLLYGEVIAEVRSMIDQLQRLERRKDPKDYVDAQAAADALIDRLEAQVTANAAAFARVTEESGAPDRNGAQLSSTNPDQINSDKNPTDDVYVSGEEAPPVPLPSLDEEDDEEEIVWCSDEYVEAAPIAEITPSQARRERPGYHWRVNCPQPNSIVAALPAILRRNGLLFERHPAFPDDAQLAAAYGQAAAHRLGLTQQRIVALSLRFGPLPFAVAALLAENTRGVKKPRAYLEGLIQRLDDDRIRVDLWASWRRLVREIGA